jgi:hypothetical protein
MNSKTLNNLAFALNAQLIKPYNSQEYIDNFLYTLTKQLSCFSIVVYKEDYKNSFDPIIIKPKNLFDIYTQYKYSISRALEFYSQKKLLVVDKNFFHLFEMPNFGYMMIHSKNRKFNNAIITILEDIIVNFTNLYLQKINNETNNITTNQLLKQLKTITYSKIVSNISKSFIEKTNNISNSTTKLKINKKYNKLDDEIFENCINELYSNNDSIIRNINIYKSLLDRIDDKNNFTFIYLVNKLENILKYTLKENNIIFEKDIEDIEIYTYENLLLEALFNIYEYLINSFKISNYDIKIIYTKIIKQNNQIIINIYTNKKTIDKENLNYFFTPNFSTTLYFVKNLISKQINGIIKADISSFTHNDILYDGLNFIIELKEKNEDY